MWIAMNCSSVDVKMETRTVLDKRIAAFDATTGRIRALMAIGANGSVNNRAQDGILPHR